MDVPLKGVSKLANYIGNLPFRHSLPILPYRKTIVGTAEPGQHVVSAGAWRSEGSAPQRLDRIKGDGHSHQVPQLPARRRIHAAVAGMLLFGLTSSCAAQIAPPTLTSGS